MWDKFENGELAEQLESNEKNCKAHHDDKDFDERHKLRHNYKSCATIRNKNLIIFQVMNCQCISVEDKPLREQLK